MNSKFKPLPAGSKILDMNRDKLDYYLYLISHNYLFMLGLFLTLLLLIAAVFAPMIAPYPEDAFGAINMSIKLKPPGLEHLMGTDEFGRDIFSRVLYGARLSLVVGASIVVIAIIIGMPLGLIAGYYGGRIDELIMRICDGFLSFPIILFPIALGGMISATMNVNLLVVNVVALGLVYWPYYVRLIRAQVLVVREQLYVKAAQSMGVKNSKIITRHILANSSGAFIVQVSLDLGYAILASASLSFLGIGASPPAAEWGLMISDARPYFFDFWWTTTFPGLAIFIAVFAFNLLGDGFKEIIDPKIR